MTDWDPTAHRPFRTPFFRVAHGDPCPVPEGMEHCHGLVITHDDGVRECHFGPDCSAPDGMHLAAVACAESNPTPQHQCPAC